MPKRRHLMPIDEPYQATILVGYLARAFNPHSAEIAHRQNPLWPMACAMVEAMTADNYHLGAYVDDDHYILARSRQQLDGTHRSPGMSRTDHPRERIDGRRPRQGPEQEHPQQGHQSRSTTDR